MVPAARPPPGPMAAPPPPTPLRPSRWCWSITATGEVSERPVGRFGATTGAAVRVAAPPARGMVPVLPSAEGRAAIPPAAATPAAPPPSPPPPPPPSLAAARAACWSTVTAGESTRTAEDATDVTSSELRSLLAEQSDPPELMGVGGE